MGQHPVVYFEILGSDGAALRDFYERLFAWRISPVEEGAGAYQRIEAEPGGIQGGLGAFPGVPNQVNYYVRCDDLAAAVARAAELGGSVVMEPRQAAEDIEVAMVADPEGHTIGLIRGV
jgi:predicted enzyme related to lactoylglutathione lyase